MPSKHLSKTCFSMIWFCFYHCKCFSFFFLFLISRPCLFQCQLRFWDRNVYIGICRSSIGDLLRTVSTQVQPEGRSIGLCIWYALWCTVPLPRNLGSRSKCDSSLGKVNGIYLCAIDALNCTI